MKAIVFSLVFIAHCISFLTSNAQIDLNSLDDYHQRKLFIDVHKLPSGKVHFNDVANAHAKDLAVQEKHGVKFLKYWVDEKNSQIYCLASAHDSSYIRKAHGEAHGLLPDHIHPVSAGDEAQAAVGGSYFLDIHEFGTNNVSAEDVAGAHKKDLGVQAQFGVNFINYWIDEKAGVVMCLSQAPDAKSVRKTHKHAHGLLPSKIISVHQGE
jgi:hypothetical protein